MLFFSATQAAPGSAAAVGGDVEESGCGTDTDPIIIIDSEEEEEAEEEKEEVEEEREEEEEEEEKEEEDDFVVKVDLSDDDVSKEERGREGGREGGRERERERGPSLQFPFCDHLHRLAARHCLMEPDTANPKVKQIPGPG